METNDGFSVEITSSYAGLWRYNLAVTCGCFDDTGNGVDNPRRDFVAAEDFVAQTGANLQQPPEGYSADRTIRFSTIACDYLLMYVYVIPHTLPVERNIADCKPFGLHICVRRGSTVVYERLHSVNCWSGTSIELRVPELQSLK